MKTLAICLFGHMRTYQQTYQSFLENVVETNKKDGWQIDIFIHTWDTFETSGHSWHTQLKDIDGKRLTDEDIAEIKRIYNPKEIMIEHLGNQHGMNLSIQRVNEILESYEQSYNDSKIANKTHTNNINNINNINNDFYTISHTQRREGKYDYILYTRPDIYFHVPLRISQYIDSYKNKELPPLPKKHIFAANNFFTRMNVADPRHNCEVDLIWFSNFKSEAKYLWEFGFTTLEGHGNREIYDYYYFNDNIPIISIDYRVNRDLFIQRIDSKLGWGSDIHFRYEELRKHYFAYILSRIAGIPKRFKNSCKKRYKKWFQSNNKTK